MRINSRFTLYLIFGFILLVLVSACAGLDAVTDKPAAEKVILGAETGESSPVGATSQVTTAPERRSYAGEVPAPEFPPELDWLNVDRPLTLEQLKGKVVLLDFWTYGCINCYHIIPDLKDLEEEFAEELVVIGVHSAKFTNEGETDNIRQIILRYELEHPVVNDNDFLVWRTWGTNAWPTTVLIDPAGNVVGGHSGEGVYQIMRPIIQSLILEFDETNQVDRTPLALKLEGEGLPETTLSFPGKVLIDSQGNRLFIADSNHHRVVLADPESGEVLRVYGNGEMGFRDGNAESASFNTPQGMALLGERLYVADTNNHAIRAIDLEQDVVSTFLGTGQQSQIYPPVGGTAPDVSLRSPWDLEIDESLLYIAMAGSHQIWSLDLKTGEVGPLVGSGREGTLNAKLLQSELAQPSGLSIDESERLFFADSESSSIRWADINSRDGQVGFLAGSDDSLFEFGDEDGQGNEVRLQHPLGVVVHEDWLYIADTYNSKIKRANMETGEVQTILGEGHGWRDGSEAKFYEPGGLDAAGRKLYVADTNNHSVRIVDLDTLETSTLVLYGIEKFERVQAGVDFRGKKLALEPVTVSEGELGILLDIELPSGYKINSLAPSSVTWSAVDVEATFQDGINLPVEPESLPLKTSLIVSAGEGSIFAELTVYYCEAEKEQFCLLDQVLIEIPVSVGPGGESEIDIPYTIPKPEF